MREKGDGLLLPCLAKKTYRLETIGSSPVNAVAVAGLVVAVVAAVVPTDLEKLFRSAVVDSGRA